MQFPLCEPDSTGLAPTPPSRRASSERAMQSITCDMYSSSWAVFLPDVIIDAKLGCLWRLQVNLSPIIKAMQHEPNRAIDFLLNRTSADAKELLLSLVFDKILSSSANLRLCSPIFNRLFARCDTAGQTSARPSSSWRRSAPVVSPSPNALSGLSFCLAELASAVLRFCQSDQQPSLGLAVLLEFFRAARKCSLTLPYELQEQLAHSLLQHGTRSQLQFIVQYRVFDDSKPLACLLLSHPQQADGAALQMALDMLAVSHHILNMIFVHTFYMHVYRTKIL